MVRWMKGLVMDGNKTLSSFCVCTLYREKKCYRFWLSFMLKQQQNKNKTPKHGLKKNVANFYHLHNPERDT